jgi:hypothetical protein
MKLGRLTLGRLLSYIVMLLCGVAIKENPSELLLVAIFTLTIIVPFYLAFGDLFDILMNEGKIKKKRIGKTTEEDSQDDETSEEKGYENSAIQDDEDRGAE